MGTVEVEVIMATGSFGVLPTMDVTVKRARDEAISITFDVHGHQQSYWKKSKSFAVRNVAMATQ